MIYALAASLNISDTPDVLMGDINMDGKVDAIDYALLKKHLLGMGDLSGDAIRIADVNHDNAVDALDLSILKKYLLGKITSL